MAAYEPTMSYRLIYIFAIHDKDHEGYLKIGDTTFDSTKSYKQLPPNCEELNQAARDRIDDYTKTAMVAYDLQYTELARKVVTFSDGEVETSLFRDKRVHEVLYRSGYTSKNFWFSDRTSEWFEVPLSVAIRAIQAVKEGRTALTAAEKSEGQTSFLPQTVPAAPKKRAITLRDEQVDCVNRTLTIFRKQNSMLWNCKMRFGKTVTAYALIKKANYQKVIVVTHRPVVEDGWRNDFDLIFGEGDNRAFLKKDRFDTDSSVYDAAMDARNDANLTAYQNSGKAFVYFASMQDLRGSQRADGKFDKNNAVFDMDWDLVIYDEAHEGTQTQRGQKVQSLLEAEKNGKAPKVLQLSGTPYNLMQKYENNVYTWDYVMEQKRKREWDTLHPGDHNPYVKPTESGDIKLRYSGGIGPFNRADVTSGLDWIDKWKVTMSYLTYDHAGRPDKNGQRRIFSTMDILPPETVCTETYIVIDCFDTEQEAKNLMAYLKTRFVRFLVAQLAATQHLSKATFGFVPVQDFTEEWTDEKLYKKYELTEDEIAFIESTIRVME